MSVNNTIWSELSLFPLRVTTCSIKPSWATAAETNTQIQHVCKSCSSEKTKRPGPNVIKLLNILKKILSSNIQVRTPPFSDSDIWVENFLENTQRFYDGGARSCQTIDTFKYMCQQMKVHGIFSPFKEPLPLVTPTPRLDPVKLSTNSSNSHVSSIDSNSKS
jgi:hypothetical protein